MKIIIAGAGDVGSHLAKMLSNEKGHFGKVQLKSLDMSMSGGS